jgi:hypothetical protein
MRAMLVFLSLQPRLPTIAYRGLRCRGLRRCLSDSVHPARRGGLERACGFELKNWSPRLKFGVLGVWRWLARHRELPIFTTPVPRFWVERRGTTRRSIQLVRCMTVADVYRELLYLHGVSLVLRTRSLGTGVFVMFKKFTSVGTDQLRRTFSSSL